MLMRSERDGDHLDAVIDAAARSLTAGEPSAALRPSVRDRIGRRSNVGWLVPAAAIAVMAVMIVGRALLGPPGGPDPSTGSGSPRAESRGNRVRPTDVRLPIDYPSRPAPELSAAPLQPDIERLVPPNPTHQVVAVPELPLEELEPLIPPLSIPPLETKLIAVETSSGVMPIEIEPLRIEPLQGE